MEVKLLIATWEMPYRYMLESWLAPSTSSSPGRGAPSKWKIGGWLATLHLVAENCHDRLWTNTETFYVILAPVLLRLRIAPILPLTLMKVSSSIFSHWSKFPGFRGQSPCNLTWDRILYYSVRWLWSGVVLSELGFRRKWFSWVKRSWVILDI